jgi:hypothetical protein
MEAKLTNENEKLLIYFDDEQHIVRRLGAAVVACWDELPEAARSKIVERAKKVFDEDATENFAAQLGAFLTAHGNRKPPATARRIDPAVSDEAAIGDDPEKKGDPYIGSPM